MHFGLLSLLPALVAITLAFATRQVLLALFLGVVTGAIVFSFGSSPDTGSLYLSFLDFEWLRLNVVESFFLAEMGTRNFAIIIFVYLWSLGGLIGLWTRTGGAVRFAVWVGRKLVRGPRTAKLFTWTLGIIFHQGGTISTILAGTTARPVLEQHAVAKEEAAYIIDSTATSGATLLPFNVWPIYVGGLVAGTVASIPDTQAGILFYFQKGMWWNWYGMLAVLSTFLMAVGLLPPVLGMRRARQRVEETGETVRPGSKPLSSKELQELRIPDDYQPGLADFLVPMMFLVGIAVGPLIIRGVVAIVRDVPFVPVVYTVEAFFLALMVAVLVAVLKGMAVRTAIDGIVEGAKGVTMAAIILGIAVTLKGVADRLGTGVFVADLLGGISPVMVAPLLMAAAMVIAFSTGTSFGTFAVLFPVAMPLAAAVLPGNETLLAMSFGAILGGSIFGDQASPISDTTILSSLAVGCDLMDHVTTQIPYAAAAAGIAVLGYVLTGFVLF